MSSLSFKVASSTPNETEMNKGTLLNQTEEGAVKLNLHTAQTNTKPTFINRKEGCRACNFICISLSNNECEK